MRCEYRDKTINGITVRSAITRNGSGFNFSISWDGGREEAYRFPTAEECEAAMVDTLRRLVERGRIGGTPAKPDGDTTPCCPAGEPESCLACVAGTAPRNAADAILAKGLAIAAAEATTPTETPYDVAEADLADFGAWCQEADARHYLADERLTLLQLIERQSRFYASWDNAAGRMFAEAMERLAFLARMTEAMDADELTTRTEAMDLSVAEDHYSRGYADGLAAGRREARAGYHGPLD
jgi:hypothetical protein